MKRVAAIPVLCLNTMIFMGNVQSQAKRSMGFHPSRCSSPNAINPEQVLCHYRSAQGKYGKTSSCPLLYRTCILNFISMKKEVCRAKFFINNQVNPSGADLSRLFPRCFPKDRQDTVVPRAHFHIPEKDGMIPVPNCFLFRIATIL
jgi:hypothetical protein